MTREVKTNKTTTTSKKRERYITNEEIQEQLKKAKRRVPFNRLVGIPHNKSLDITSRKILSNLQGNKRGSIGKQYAPIFQFDFRSGVSLISNFGEINNLNIDYYESNFTYIANVFTGKEPILINWVDSCLAKNSEQSPNEFEMETFIGWTRIAKIINITSSTDIGKNASDETLLNMTSDMTIEVEINANNQFNITGDQEIVDELSLWDDFDELRDERRLYILPTIQKNTLFFISNHTKTWENGHWIHNITFSTLRDKLQKSGRALEQYVNYGLSIGGWFTYPLVKETDNGFRIEMDETTENRSPINCASVKYFGNIGLNNVVFFGRPVLRKDYLQHKHIIRPSRALFFYEYIPLQDYSIDKLIASSNNLSLIEGGELQIVYTKNGFDEKLNTGLENTKQLDNQGQLTFNTQRTPFYSKDGNIEYYTGNNISNTALRSIIPYYNTDLTWGSTDIDYDIWSNWFLGTPTIKQKTDDNFWERMKDNFFIFSQNISLAVSRWSTTNYYMKDIPLLGKVFNIFGLGNISLDTKEDKQTMNDLNLFVDTYTLNAFNLYNLKTTEDGKNGLMLSVFNNTDDMNKLFGGGNRTLKIDGWITDNLLHKTHGDYKNTIYIGQYHDENGNNFDTNGNRFKVEDYKPVAPIYTGGDNDVIGYEIDLVSTQALFMGDIRIGFFNVMSYGGNYGVQEPIASILTQSQSKYSGSILDWTTTYKTNGYDNEILFETTPATYPRAITPKVLSDWKPENYRLTDFDKNTIDIFWENWGVDISDRKEYNRLRFNNNITQWDYSQVSGSNLTTHIGICDWEHVFHNVFYTEPLIYEINNYNKLSFTLSYCNNDSMNDITLTIDGNDWNTLKNGGIVVKVVNYEFNSTFLTNYNNNYNFGATKEEDGDIFYDKDDYGIWNNAESGSYQARGLVVRVEYNTSTKKIGFSMRANDGWYNNETTNIYDSWYFYGDESRWGTTKAAVYNNQFYCDYLQLNHHFTPIDFGMKAIPSGDFNFMSHVIKNVELKK